MHGCGHRGIAYEGTVEGLKGNMRELRRHKFVCSKCGSRAWGGIAISVRSSARRQISSIMSQR